MRTPKHIADKPHAFIQQDVAGRPGECKICGENESDPRHVAPAVDLPPIELKPLVNLPPIAPMATIRTGFEVTTRIVIRDAYQYIKVWKVVAESEDRVRAFFAANVDLGEVVKIEDRGPLMEIL